MHLLQTHYMGGLINIMHLPSFKLSFDFADITASLRLSMHAQVALRVSQVCLSTFLDPAIADYCGGCESHVHSVTQ